MDPVVLLRERIYRKENRPDANHVILHSMKSDIESGLLIDTKLEYENPALSERAISARELFKQGETNAHHSRLGLPTAPSEKIPDNNTVRRM